MKPRFENRAVIITGALGGIGLAVARRFAAEGARLTLLDLNADQGGEGRGGTEGLGRGGRPVSGLRHR